MLTATIDFDKALRHAFALFTRVHIEVSNTVRSLLHLEVNLDKLFGAYIIHDG